MGDCRSHPPGKICPSTFPLFLESSFQQKANLMPPLLSCLDVFDHTRLVRLQHAQQRFDLGEIRGQGRQFKQRGRSKCSRVRVRVCHCLVWSCRGYCQCRSFAGICVRAPSTLVIFDGHGHACQPRDLPWCVAAVADAGLLPPRAQVVFPVYMRLGILYLPSHSVGHCLSRCWVVSLPLNSVPDHQAHRSRRWTPLVYKRFSPMPSLKTCFPLPSST
jgi:hypothetical protein